MSKLQKYIIQKVCSLKQKKDTMNRCLLATVSAMLLCNFGFDFVNANNGGPLSLSIGSDVFEKLEEQNNQSNFSQRQTNRNNNSHYNSQDFGRNQNTNNRQNTQNNRTQNSRNGGRQYQYSNEYDNQETDEYEFRNNNRNTNGNNSNRNNTLRRTNSAPAIINSSYRNNDDTRLNNDRRVQRDNSENRLNNNRNNYYNNYKDDYYDSYSRNNSQSYNNRNRSNDSSGNNSRDYNSRSNSRSYNGNYNDMYDLQNLNDAHQKFEDHRRKWLEKGMFACERILEYLKPLMTNSKERFNIAYNDRYGNNSSRRQMNSQGRRNSNSNNYGSEEAEEYRKLLNDRKIQNEISVVAKLAQKGADIERNTEFCKEDMLGYAENLSKQTKAVLDMYGCLLEVLQSEYPIIAARRMPWIVDV